MSAGALAKAETLAKADEALDEAFRRPEWDSRELVPPGNGIVQMRSVEGRRAPPAGVSADYNTSSLMRIL
jgi:hypothetical protein